MVFRNYNSISLLLKSIINKNNVHNNIIKTMHNELNGK